MTTSVQQLAMIVMCAAAVWTIVVFFHVASSTVLDRAWTQLMSETRQKTASWPCPLPGAGTFSLTPLPSTALVSFPGSGNTWTQYMLTTASGLLTGTTASSSQAVTVTGIFGRRKNRKPYRVIAIETHDSVNVTQTKIPVDRSILLIRNPYEAILEEFAQQSTREEVLWNTAISPRQRFEHGWLQVVTNWSSLYKSWATSEVPLHVMVYDRMISGLKRELGLVFQFLDISANIDCAVRSPEGWAHHRKPAWQDEVAEYSRDQVLYLNNAIDEVQAALERRTGAKFDEFQSWKRTWRKQTREETPSWPCPLPGAGTFSFKPLPSTTLVSFPGSGNTWTRHLLTTASGLLTGTVYGSSVGVTVTTEGDAVRVIAIKTHLTPDNMTTRIPVDRSILLIRNPYEAILAEFNRRSSKEEVLRNTAISPERRFKDEWAPYVSSHMTFWLKLYLSWAATNVPLHVMVYNRMTSDLPRELGLVFQFLNISANIDCAMRSPEGWAHRQKPAWQDEVAVYSQGQVLYLNKAIDEVQAALERKTGAKFDDFQSWKR